MNTRSHAALHRIVMMLVLAGVGWAVGTFIVPEAAGRIAAARSAPLPSNGDLPNVPVSARGQGPRPLLPVLENVSATHLLVLAATCSSCLGELESWERLSQIRHDVRVVVLIFSESEGYLQYVNELIKPTYPIFLVAESTLPAIGARRMPVLYSLTAARTVSSAFVGVEAVASARSQLDATQMTELPAERESVSQR